MTSINGYVAPVSDGTTSDINSAIAAERAEIDSDLAAGLLQEGGNRTSAIAAETSARTAAISGEVTNRNAAIAVETSARVAMIASEIATETSARTAAISAEATARDAAIAAQIIPDNDTPIWIISDEATRDALPSRFPDMRVWSVLEDSRAEYDGATWTAVAESWGQQNSYVYMTGDLPASGSPGSAREFLVGKSIRGVEIQNGTVEG